MPLKHYIIDVAFESVDDHTRYGVETYEDILAGSKAQAIEIAMERSRESEYYDSSINFVRDPQISYCGGVPIYLAMPLIEGDSTISQTIEDALYDDPDTPWGLADIGDCVEEALDIELDWDSAETSSRLLEHFNAPEQLESAL